MSFGALAPLPERLSRDPRRARSAAQHARACADRVAIVRSLPLAVVVVNCTATASTVVAYGGMNGMGLSRAPSVTHHAVGDFTLEWQPQYADDYEGSYPWQINGCRSSGGSSSFRKPVWEITEPNKVRVRNFVAHGGSKSTGYVTVVVL